MCFILCCKDAGLHPKPSSHHPASSWSSDSGKTSRSSIIEKLRNLGCYLVSLSLSLFPFYMLLPFRIWRWNENCLGLIVGAEAITDTQDAAEAGWEPYKAWMIAFEFGYSTSVPISRVTISRCIHSFTPAVLVSVRMSKNKKSHGTATSVCPSHEALPLPRFLAKPVKKRLATRPWPRQWMSRKQEAVKTAVQASRIDFHIVKLCYTRWFKLIEIS